MTSRHVVKALSGYLCGTHSGLLQRARRARGANATSANPNAISGAHRELGEPVDGERRVIGIRQWDSSSETAGLASALRKLVNRDEVIDLIVYGSQARGTTTGFSDLDAVLVLSDETVEDPSALRSLRPHVLAAQRAVLSYQPMQHHGFELATPKLLRSADSALALPEVALDDASSVGGTPVTCYFNRTQEANRQPVLKLATTLAAVAVWPRHPWHVHRLVAMFEMLPVLYLQSRGRMVPKWQSFREVQGEFGEAWWPYDALERVRDAWPRKRRIELDAFATVVRNPWAAVAVWRSLPYRISSGIAHLLSNECLSALRSIARDVAARA